MVAIPQAELVHSLGLLLDLPLLVEEQLAAMFLSVSLCPIPGLGHLAHPLVTSWLNYYNAFYMGLPLKTHPEITTDPECSGT